MGRSIASRRTTRFERLTPEQRTALTGVDTLVLTGKLRAYTGRPGLLPFFMSAVKGFESDVLGFEAALPLTDAFVLMCNDPDKDSPGSFGVLREQLRNGLLEFARAKGLHPKALHEWPADVAVRMLRWLRFEATKKDGSPYSSATIRKRYGAFCAMFGELGENPKLAALLPELQPFPNNPLSGAHADGGKTQSLGPSTLVAVLRAARADVLDVVQKFRYAQKLFQEPEVPLDTSRRGEGQFRSIDAVLWYLKTQYPNGFPLYTSLRDSKAPTERALFEAIRRLHGGWRNVSEYFQPLPESCVAPMLLLTIYGHFNTEPMRILRLKDVRQISLLGSDRVDIRTAVQPGKERGKAYRRSFPVDDADPASPNSLLGFMVEWTEAIRKRAGRYRDCVFISVTAENNVKAFSSVQLDGRSSDSKWLHHLKEFCARHRLPRFNLRQLRLTSLDYGMSIFEEDLRATLAMKGGESEATLRLHYTSDAAHLRANTQIAELQDDKERYVRTKGAVHHLGAHSKDLSAATPGCKCVDPYDSPILSEVRGRRCGAFGQCPGCPLGSPEFSGYGLARLLQLREAVNKARMDMPLQRWEKCWKPVVETLEKKWLLLFETRHFEQAKRMSLPPIGVIE